MLKFATINPQDAFKIMEEKGSEITILDIRPKNDYEEEHVPGCSEFRLQWDMNFRKKWK